VPALVLAMMVVFYLLFVVMAACELKYRHQRGRGLEETHVTFSWRHRMAMMLNTGIYRRLCLHSQGKLSVAHRTTNKHQ